MRALAVLGSVMTMPLSAVWACLRQYTRLRSVRIVAAGAVVVALAQVMCRSPEREPLPAKVAEVLTRQTLTAVSDTTEIHRLVRVAAVAQQQDAELRSRARRSTEVAARAGHHADSLARSAARVQQATDSSVQSDVWKGAYVFRTAQVMALLDAVALEDAALAQASARSSALDSALTRSELRATRADSVIRLLVPVAEARVAPCRVLGVVPCPSRTAVAAGSVVLTLVAVGSVVRHWRHSPKTEPCGVTF